MKLPAYSLEMHGIVRKPFAEYVVDVSEFVHRRLRKYEPILMAAFQAKWPDRNIAKVTVVPCTNNEDARDAVGSGGTFRVFRRERMAD